MNRPPELYLLFILLFLLAVNGLAGGGLLILKPDGSLLQLDPAWINNTPFKDYRLPGLMLLVFNGVFPMLALLGLLFRPTWNFNLFNIYKDRYWAWSWSLFSGIILIIWITVQQLLTRYFWLQPLLSILGLLIIICTMMPRIIKYYSLNI